MKKLEALGWQTTTAEGNIAGKATFQLDRGLRYLDAARTGEFLKLTGNLPAANMFTGLRRTCAGSRCCNSSTKVMWPTARRSTPTRCLYLYDSALLL